MIDHVRLAGGVDPALIYGPPFTDFAPRGPEEIFGQPMADELFSLMARFPSTEQPAEIYPNRAEAPGKRR